MIYGFTTNSVVKANGIVSNVVRLNGQLYKLTKTQLKAALREYYKCNDVFLCDGSKEDTEWARVSRTELPLEDFNEWMDGRLSLYEYTEEDGQEYQSGRQPKGLIKPLSIFEKQRQKVIML